MATLSRPLARLRRDDMQPNNAHFDTLFEAHWARVYRLLYRLLGDADSAEELALDVFWQLYRTPPTVRDEDELAGWLYRVALRRGYNTLRAANRRDKYEQAAVTSARAPNPSKVVERAEEVAQVRATLQAMKARSAELLMLRYSGLSYREIAATLGIAPGSVGTLLARAEKEFEALFPAGGWKQ